MLEDYSDFAKATSDAIPKNNDFFFWMNQMA